MKSQVEKLPKSTVKITVTVDQSEVKNIFESVINDYVKDTEVKGFRKGNAPREMVVESVGLEKIKADVVNKLLQTYYPQAIKENQIFSVSNPQVEIKDFDPEKDLEFTATIAVRPEVTIGDYKQKLAEIYKQKKDAKNKENEEKIKKGEKIDDSHVHLSPTEVINTLVDLATLEVSDLLTADETDRMMARLVDQAQTIGLSLEQYLKAQNKTPQELRNDYSAIAERNLKGEFVLGHLVKDRNITVSDEEIENTMKAAGYSDTDKRIDDPVEKMYVQSILQKNKLISNIIEETEDQNAK